jgi:hypothetical protein
MLFCTSYVTMFLEKYNFPGFKTLLLSPAAYGPPMSIRSSFLSGVSGDLFLTAFWGAGTLSLMRSQDQLLTLYHTGPLLLLTLSVCCFRIIIVLPAYRAAMGGPE